MNKLPLNKRVQIIAMPCEGSSMRSISRAADVSIDTVSKLLVEAGEACLAIHDDTVGGVKGGLTLPLKHRQVDYGPARGQIVRAHEAGGHQYCNGNLTRKLLTSPAAREGARTTGL